MLQFTDLMYQWGSMTSTIEFSMIRHTHYAHHNIIQPDGIRHTLVWHNLQTRMYQWGSMTSTVERDGVQHTPV